MHVKSIVRQLMVIATLDEVTMFKMLYRTPSPRLLSNVVVVPLQVSAWYTRKEGTRKLLVASFRTSVCGFSSCRPQSSSCLPVACASTMVPANASIYIACSTQVTSKCRDLQQRLWSSGEGGSDQVWRGRQS